MISKESIQRIRELLKKEYIWTEEEISELKELIKKKRKLKNSTPSGGEKLECWRKMSQWINRLKVLKERRKKLQQTMKEIKCEF